MSRRPIDRSPVLKKLRDEGYDIEVVDGYLVLHDVPYVTAQIEVKRGVLLAPLDLVDDVALPPSDHQAKWSGEAPCNEDGTEMQGLGQTSSPMTISGHAVSLNFSCKPTPSGKYDDFHHKMTQYVDKISGPAYAMDPTMTAKTYNPRPADPEDSVFLYEDTASSRAEIVAINGKLKQLRIGIVGLGGTGSYVLDFVAKTPVKEIHLFDSDTFDQHNAFRAPGAASGEALALRSKKVSFHVGVYAKLRRGIVPHPLSITSDTAEQLRGLDFVFLCMEGTGKRPVVEKLELMGIPFVDVGMGITINNNQLRGQLRTTTSTPTMRNHVHSNHRIAFKTQEEANEYDKNIQVAELNALNAALAVIKWKKLFGFYADDEHEHFSVYVISGNESINEDQG